MATSRDKKSLYIINIRDFKIVGRVANAVVINLPGAAAPSRRATAVRLYGCPWIHKPTVHDHEFEFGLGCRIR
jgi:hypothetical protein